MTRPDDVWRVCGLSIADGPGGGCTCTPNDPTRWQARRALDRLNSEKGGPVQTAPRHERGTTRKAGR